ncbi:PfkB domain protein [Halorubrum californiense DSM 19288]|uniref:PfkB domain protein n=1 Tax=Halorubrum californiense DSM 19288 TaxID=1227465 RepID=M0EGN0_9EURY|nr:MULTISPECIES: carbohydrate kinase [Halorubrum]ELZ46233.1 PfkB domain protein [Halorubrum californiense DSM 19288]TKX70529.1 carbohydrate kinase [Halorubrum sp. GN11GM_10-3_MGM]
MTDVFVAGETLVDFVPDAGETLREVDGYAHRPGGAPANVAVGLARLGSPPAFWTRLGDDAFGDFLAETLSAEGIPETHVERVPGKTTLAVVSPPGAEGPQFGFYGSRDATFGFDPDAVPVGTLTGDADAAGSPADASAPPWVHLGGVALTHPRGRAATRELLSAASATGCPVSFDVNYRSDLVPDGAAETVSTAVREAVTESDVVFCSDEDIAAAGLSTSEGVELARDLLALGPHTAVVTLGSDGALAVSSDAAPWGAATVRHGGFAVEAVDATGAGDAFTAGLLSRLAGDAGETPGIDDGNALREALAVGNATAALSVRSVGGMGSIPSRKEVDAFLTERE